MKDKFLWYTDTHLDLVAPWTLANFIRRVRNEKPKGIFLTGDISNGVLTCFHLKILSKFVPCPIYFVLGNHDYHFCSMEEQHDKIRAMCRDYPNLIWLTESSVIGLNDEVALIGTEGWYDCQLGNPQYLRATLDWFLTEDFKQLPTMNERIDAFIKLADKSCDIIEKKLQQALDDGYKSVYILTHFPPWKEATRFEGTFLQKYHLPYNVNLRLGRTIERIMEERKKRNVTVLAGHTHSDCWIHVSRNIECKVNRAKYYAYGRNEEHIFI